MTTLSQTGSGSYTLCDRSATEVAAGAGGALSPKGAAGHVVAFGRQAGTFHFWFAPPVQSQI
jgi:hypothetical protein